MGFKKKNEDYLSLISRLALYLLLTKWRVMTFQEIADRLSARCGKGKYEAEFFLGWVPHLVKPAPVAHVLLSLHLGFLPSRLSSVSRILSTYILRMGLPLWLSGKESASSSGATGDLGLIPRSGRSLGGGHNNPLQYSYLENPMDRGAWLATVNGVAKSWTRLKWLTTHILWIPVYIILSKKTAFSLKFCP